MVQLVGAGHTRVFFADMDGYYDATLVDPDTIEMFYRHVTDKDTVAAVGPWKRKK